MKLVLAGVLALAVAMPAIAQEAAKPLSAHLTGAAEKPKPGDPDGMGHATVRVDAAKNQVCWDLAVEKIAPATAAHIHKGGPEVAGPPVVPLTKPDAAGKSKGCAATTAAVVKDLQQNPGGYYVNVHTADFPPGAVRGQLTK